MEGQKKDQLLIQLLYLSISSKNYRKKKLISILFIDIKRAFDYFSNWQLFIWIIKHEINGDFVI